MITGLLIGTVIGWVTSLIANAGGREALVRNVAVGIAGAFVGSWLLNSLLEPADQTGFSFGAVSASLVGAAALLLVVNRLSRT